MEARVVALLPPCLLVGGASLAREQKEARVEAKVEARAEARVEARVVAKPRRQRTRGRRWRWRTF